jgi:hypothetical protein
MFGFHKRSRLFIAPFLLTTLGLWNGLETAAIAQYVPPDVGLPGRREGGGTRGDCFQNAQQLTALMPETNYGVTLSDYPTFLFYLPEIPEASVEFLLLDQDGNEIYQSAYQVSTGAGIMSLSLPETAGLPPLEVGKRYEWIFSLVCDPLDRSGDVFVSGWVERKDEDLALSTTLESTPESDRPNTYAQSGIWYDAIESLVDMRRADPSNPELMREWDVLLTSVGLEELADKPFVNCCTAVSQEEAPPEPEVPIIELLPLDLYTPSPSPDQNVNVPGMSESGAVR